MDFKRIAREQLALEYGVKPEFFLQEENLLTVSALHEGRRRYGSKPPAFQMATFGRNAVLTARPDLHPFLQNFLRISPGYELFHQDNAFQLEKILNEHNLTLAPSYHMFLPHHTVQPKGKFSIRWYFGEELEPLRAHPVNHFAISSPANALRPDRIAVAALDGENIIGLAACSEDAPRWMQIGVDVLPAYRGRGIAAELVTLLKNRILQDGNIPFYGTTLSNYASWNTAIAAGFAPTFIEMAAFSL